jgi:hypothetical protein
MSLSYVVPVFYCSSILPTTAGHLLLKELELSASYTYGDERAGQSHVEQNKGTTTVENRHYIRHSDT